MIPNIVGALSQIIVICFVAFDFRDRGAALIFAELLFWSTFNSFKKKGYKGPTFVLYKMFGFLFIYAFWWAIMLGR